MKKIIKYSKIGQLSIVTIFFILSVLIFLYSIETQSYYNYKKTKYDIQSVIEMQFCNHVELSNGTILNNSLENFEIFIQNYCSISADSSCLLNISILPTLPDNNISLLNASYVKLNYYLIQNNVKTNGVVYC